jgi:pimeloyl-ACP methyl ester carboxylesterase
VQQLIDFVGPVSVRYGQTPFLIGHSLGGLLSLMAASRAPEIARGVLMLDAPVVGGWQARVVQVVVAVPADTTCRRLPATNLVLAIRHSYFPPILLSVLECTAAKTNVTHLN